MAQAAVGEVALGSRGAAAPNLDGADWLRHLGPTNVSYLGEIGNGLTVQGGIFTSFIGYEAYQVTPHITVKQTVLTGPHQSDTALTFWWFLSNTIVERWTGHFIAALDFHVATERVDTSEPVRAWWVAAQTPIRWNLRGPWSVAVRPEMAWDSDGRWTLAAQTVKALTTTLEYRLARKWSTASLRLEHRWTTRAGRRAASSTIANCVPASSR